MNAADVSPRQKSRSKAVARPERLFFNVDTLGDFSPPSSEQDVNPGSSCCKVNLSDVIVRSRGSSEVFRLCIVMADCRKAKRCASEHLR